MYSLSRNSCAKAFAIGQVEKNLGPKIWGVQQFFLNFLKFSKFLENV